MDDLRIQIAHMGIAGDSQGEVHDTTWGEFVAANPDFDPIELRHILKMIRAGQSFREQTDEGMFEIRPLNEQEMSDEEAKAFTGFKKIPQRSTIATANAVYVNPRGDSFMIRNGHPFRARYKNLNGEMIWVTSRIALARMINATTRDMSGQGVSRNSDLIRQIMKSKSMGDTMKTNENSSGCATGAGSVAGSAKPMFSVKRTMEGDGEEEVTDECSGCVGKVVEFTRNSVPYRGVLESVEGNSAVVNIGGRRLTVETALIGLNGAPEPESHGPVQYGVKTAKQDHAQSSPTTPNRTMQKFVGASEDLGDDSADSMWDGEDPGEPSEESGEWPDLAPEQDQSPRHIINTTENIGDEHRQNSDRIRGHMAMMKAHQNETGHKFVRDRDGNCANCALDDAASDPDRWEVRHNRNNPVKPTGSIPRRSGR